MKIFAALIVALTSATKVTAQGSVSRCAVKNRRDMFTLNALIFIATSIVLAAIGFRAIPPAKVLIWSLILSIVTLAFQLGFTEAFRCGPISLTMILVTCNVAFPIITDVIVFGEKLSLSDIFGFVFMAVTFILIYGKSNKGVKINNRWIMFTLLALLGAGLSNTMIQLFSRSEFAAYNKPMLTINYLIASAICACVSYTMKKEDNNVHLDIKNILLILVVITALGLNNVLLSEYLKTIPGSFLYPAYNVMSAMLTLAADMIIFKVRLSGRQILGIVCGAVAVILMNM